MVVLCRRTIDGRFVDSGNGRQRLLYEKEEGDPRQSPRHRNPEDPGAGARAIVKVNPRHRSRRRGVLGYAGGCPFAPKWEGV